MKHKKDFESVLLDNFVPFWTDFSVDKEYDELIESLGGVDMCFWGLGINGHIAFNEPPEVDERLPQKNLPHCLRVFCLFPVKRKR